MQVTINTSNFTEDFLKLATKDWSIHFHCKNYIGKASVNDQISYTSAFLILKEIVPSLVFLFLIIISAFYNHKLPK